MLYKAHKLFEILLANKIFTYAKSIAKVAL